MLGLMQSRPLLISGPRRLRLDLAWRPGDRIARPGRRDSSLQLCRSRGARQTGRQRARRARGAARRSRRDARLERLSPSRNLLRRHQLGPRAAHRQSAPVSRAAPIHHASRRRRLCLLRSDFRAAGRAARAASAAGARLGRALRARRAARRRSRRTCSATRICWRRRRPTTTGRTSTRTPPPRSATPRARPAIRRACSTATARRCCTPSPPAPPTRSALRARDSILVVVPLFHANAWSLPFSAAMCGAKLVLPGPKLDPESLYMLLEQRGLHQGVRHSDDLAQLPRLGGSEQRDSSIFPG